MITAIGRVMIYVNNPRAVADFWIHKIGFVEIQQQPAPDNTVSVEIAPAKQADTSFVLFSKDMIAKYEPELTLGTPSIMLNCSNLEQTHTDLQAKGVAASEIAEMGGLKTFNFPDNEGNYFAIREVK